MNHLRLQERKAVLDRCQVDTVFRVGNQVLLWAKELLDAAEIGKLRPRWEGPFPVAEVAGPNTNTLDLHRHFKCSPAQLSMLTPQSLLSPRSTARSGLIRLRLLID